MADPRPFFKRVPKTVHVASIKHACPYIFVDPVVASNNEFAHPMKVLERAAQISCRLQMACVNEGPDISKR